MDNFYSRLVLLLICILSRMLSSIHYLEDTESLMSALSIISDFSFNEWGETGFFNFLFIIVAKGLFFIFQDLAVVYSLLGGIALYFIILFILRLLNVPILSLEGFITSLLIFFNPMIWIMSNQYIPDLAGTAIAIASFYYLVPDTYRKNDVLIGCFLFGLIGGVKAFYIPFLIIPFFYGIISKGKLWQGVCFLFLGLATWILPLLFLAGPMSIQSKIQDSFILHYGQFLIAIKEFGIGQMVLGLFQSIWADGLGGYWPDRSISLLFTSVGLGACLFFGFFILLNFDKNKAKIGVLIFSILLYTIWALLFGEVIYQSSSVLLLIPYLMILVAYGIIYFLVNFNFIFVKVFALLFILGNVFLTVVLVVQHTYPSAVAQAKEHILTRKNSNEKVTIVAPEKLSAFLSSQNIQASFVPASEDSIFSTAYKLRNSSDRIIIVGFSSPIKDRNVIHFSHNPYVNRRWSQIFLYEYSNK